MEHNIHINNEYAAILLIEILFEEGLVNKLTYIRLKQKPNKNLICGKERAQGTSP